MNNFENIEQILEDNSVINSEEVIFKNKPYKKKRVNENVERGGIKNLVCVTFRNEEEHHDIDVYHLEEKTMFVETGYGLN